MISKIVVMIVVMVLSLSGPAEVLLGQKHPNQICRERCEKDHNNCVNSAYDWYERCKRHNEELQCREELRRMVGLCGQDYDYCMQGCS